MSGITVQRDRYDHPICRKCGHDTGYHDTSRCRAPIFASAVDLNAKPSCDCTGWERDPGWPPPIVVNGDVAEAIA